MRYLAAFIFLLPAILIAQLPKPSVIAENNIRCAEVWKHRLEPLVEVESSEFVDNELSELKKETPLKEHLYSWFFNKSGYPDSCWVFYHYANEKRSFIYKYNEQGLLVFLQENKNNQMLSRSKLVFLENGNIQSLNWNKNLKDWALGYTLDKDSLAIKFGVVTDSTAYYFDDRESGVISRARLEDGEVRFRYTEQWIVDDEGAPDSLIISFVQLEDISNVSWKSDSFVKGFKLREDGSVIPAHGMNYYNLNYYKRGNKKRPFSEKSPFDDVLKNYLSANRIIYRSDTITTRRFSDIHPRHYLEYRYTKY